MRNRIDARTTILKILDLRVESSVDEDTAIFVIAAQQDDLRCGLRTAGKPMRFNTLIVSTRRAAPVLYCQARSKQTTAPVPAEACPTP
jgi:hypothetical protein